jgi:hypothetical protein
LAIAYLGSADCAAQMQESMGCHQWNGHVNESRQPADTPLCGGWIRAARGTIAVRLRLIAGSVDVEDIMDLGGTMSVEEMARVNGLDVDRLPPLAYDHLSDRYASHAEWTNAVVTLRQAILATPDLAWEYVIPGSPLAEGVDRDQVAAAMGEEAASRYFDAE